LGIACPTTTTYTDTGLINGTPYYYVVSSFYTAGPNAGGESADSNEANATAAAASLPTPPTNVTASRGNPRGSISLKWAQSVTPGVTQNYVYRRTNSGSYPSTPTAKVAAATSYSDSKLISGSTYCYVVTAVNSVGESAKSQPEACASAK
jgi:cellulose 1,4-beta-cellobiosidase